MVNDKIHSGNWKWNKDKDKIKAIADEGSNQNLLSAVMNMWLEKDPWFVIRCEQTQTQTTTAEEVEKYSQGIGIQES